MRSYKLLTLINIIIGIDSRSQEIIWSPSVFVLHVVLIWSWVELQESVLHELINLHNGGFVTTSVTVVWS